MERLISPDATLKQIYAAADILRQDMKNRHEAYADQVKAISARISAPRGAGAGNPGAAAPVSGQLPTGAGKDANESVIRQFLEASGGDKEKARKALGEKGWKIPAGK